MIKLDENAPEYYVMDCVVTDEMAEVGLAMELRKPQTLAKISKKCGKSLEETGRLARELAQVGACIFHTENGEDVFELTVFVPGVMEKMVENKELCEKFPAIPRAFEEYARLRGSMLAPMMPVGKGPMRVIPIQSAIDGDSRKIGFEEVSVILNKAKRFAVGDCTCRRSRRLLGQGCGHLEQDMCIQLDTGAEYYIRTGRAREITREEAFEIIKKAEDNGLMHSIPNIDNGTTHAICNCCACGCYSMRNAIMFNSPDMIRSNYISEVDSENCVACGQCVENCPTNALKLGQKLCSTKPLVVVPYKTAHDHVLKEEDWNVNYRENRKDVVDSGTAPCKTACPAHIAVQGYIKLASQARYLEALELIKKENPFPAVCGRICPRACESECTRGMIDSPIAIDEIKKFIADKELCAETRFVPTKRYDYGKKMAIVGAGPGGLSCAYYLALDGYKVTVFEKQEKLGGMLTLGIPSFRLEKDVVNAEIDILREMGVEFKTGVEVGKDITLNDLRNDGFKAIYLAIGAQGGRKLGIEGEDAEGVITGVEFLRNVNLGQDAKLSGKVVVIGGGNVAIDVARTATRQSAEAVSMYCLESANEMPALPEEIEEASSESIAINNGWGPKRIVTKNGKVTGVEFKKCVSVFDNGKFAPKYDENNTVTVPADYVLLSVGQSIEWGELLSGSKVELGRGNTALADSFTYQTAAPDVFVGGDVYTGPKYAIDAITAGKQGAISMHRFVWEGQSLVFGRDRREYSSLDKGCLDEQALTVGFDNTPRQKAGHNAGNEKSFKDTRVTFTEEQLKKETERCLGCGAVQVDTTICVGCGQCTTKCMFDAIKLVRKYNEYATTYEKLPLKMGPNVVKRAGKIAITAVREAAKGGNS
ncbi:MAG: pyridine nucleotide-disulfide oxidoreductase [Firmicutes bacterium HGW-Firmicutes-16]|nr:MAG: pyridine nucleotide-disulfide oxidoreductase [Firmicutes bacterium HGW-Firmicutes-16]